MSLFAALLVVLSSILHAVRDFITKKAYDKRVFVFLYEIFALIFFFPLFIYFLTTYGITNFQVFIIVIIASVFHFSYWVFLSKSLEKGDLSHVYPIMRASPALVLVFSILFLKEQPSTFGIIGIILIVLGVYSINIKKFSLAEFITPAKGIFYEEHTLFAFITMLTVVGYSIVDKVGTQYTHPIIYVYLLTLFTLIPYLIFTLNTRSISLVKQEWKKNSIEIMINGFIVIFGYSLILFAFTLSKVSYVVGLRQLSIIFAVLLGSHVLNEKHKLLRLLSGVVIFIGAFLITLAK